jgi:hypothetical protein
MIIILKKQEKFKNKVINSNEFNKLDYFNNNNYKKRQ